MKFRKRKIKKKYKRKEYCYPKYLMEFPSKANSQIEPHKNKNFDDITITVKNTPKQEFVNIQLVRNKSDKEISDQEKR